MPTTVASTAISKNVYVIEIRGNKVLKKSLAILKKLTHFTKTLVRKIQQETQVKISILRET